jgi:hypothetical protein
MQSFRLQAAEQNAMPAVHPNGESSILFGQTVPFRDRAPYNECDETKSPLFE